MARIVGRTQEKKTLARLLRSKEAEFLAIYGRRRVGKTFLIREYYRDKAFIFEAVGEKDGRLKDQLQNFAQSMQASFAPGVPLKTPSSWKEAFGTLTTLIQNLKPKRKVVLFLDELPWLATRRSGMIQALDYFWNKTWSRMPNLILIACGSAAAWILETLIHAKGGLYNRLTETLHLKPFSLSETSDYLAHRKVRLTPAQCLELYMVLGGIPYYLKLIPAGASTTQIINQLCFNRDAPLFSEFERLFYSLFEHADVHLKLIRAIAKKRFGINRNELLKATKLMSGGTLKKRLDELEASSFIERFTPFGHARKNYYLKVIDEYTLFYLHWIEHVKESRTVGRNRNYWLSVSKGPSFVAWSGYAFEAVCYKHADRIIHALGLDGLAKEIGTWRFSPKKGVRTVGAQIDLLIDRSDDAITLCEIKYAKNPFKADKSFARDLSQKSDTFIERTGTRKQIFWSLITPHGLHKNLWSEDLITSDVTLNDLFKTES